MPPSRGRLAGRWVTSTPIYPGTRSATSRSRSTTSIKRSKRRCASPSDPLLRGGKPSAELAERLREDEATLRRELRWSDAFALAKAGRWTAALERLRELETLATDAAERQRIETLRRQLEQRRNGVTRRRIGWGVAAAVIGLFWLANLDSGPIRRARRADRLRPRRQRTLMSDQDFFGRPGRS